MKTRILSFLLLLLFVLNASAATTLHTISIGTNANDGTGDTLRGAFAKVNSNFTAQAVLFGNSNGIVWLTNGALTIISNGLTGQALTYSNGVPQWVEFPAAAAASVTNAIGTVKTNGVTVGSANTATSLDFVTGSNTVVRMTNTAGAVTVEINAVASAGGGGAGTNANQFANDTGNILTLKDGLQITNPVSRGFSISQTNRTASINVTNDVAFADGQFQILTSGGLFQIYNQVSGAIGLSINTNTDAIIVGTAGQTESIVLAVDSRVAGVLQVTSTNFVGTLALPNVDTNQYLFLGGGSNVVGRIPSNTVVVAAGTGGITVTPSGSGGVMTFTVSDDDAGGGSTTNFNTLGVGSQTLGSLMLTNPVGMVAPNMSIWDDFEGFSGTVASLSGRKPRGGFVNYRISGVNSNNALVTNGVIKYPDGLAVDNQAIYIIATNTTANAHNWNHAYMKLRFTNDAAYGGGITDVPTFLIEDDAAPDGVEGIHIYITTGILNAFVGNSNILSLPLNANVFNQEFVFGFTAVSNTLFVQVGKDVYIGTHPGIHDKILTGNNLTWELIGAGTNQYRMSITEIGAGWADPGLQAFAGRAMTIGTNGTIAGLKMDAVTASRAAVFDANKLLTNSATTATELGYVSGVTSAIQTQFLGTSNRVVVAAGTGGITVTPSGSGGIMTFTVNDDDAGGGTTTNFTTLAAGSLTVGTVIASNLVQVGRVDVLTNLNAGTVTSTNGSLLSGTNVIPSGSSLTVHVLTNNGVGVFQHSSYLNGRWVPNIEKTGSAIPIGNSSGPNYSIATNQALTFTFSGSPVHAQQVSLTVSNTSTTNFAVGFPSTFAAQFGSNITSLSVMASNYLRIPFTYSTNEVGGGIWLLGNYVGAENELQAGTLMNFTTNGLAVTANVNTNFYPYKLWVTNVATMGSIQTNKDNVWLEGNIKGGLAAWFNTVRAQTFTATNSVDAPLGTFGQVDVRTNAYVSALTVTNSVTIGSTNVVAELSGKQAASIVLSNLVAHVATTVTNESSTALQINSGVLTLSPGVVSNLVASTIDIAPGNIITNVIAQKWNIWTNYVQTVSNFVFTFNTNRYELKNQTNVVFTNIVEEATAVGADIAVHIHNTTGATIGLRWPAYGAQHGYFFQTNVNNPILTSTTLTTGKHGVASFTAFGTNIFATWSEWP